MFIKVSNYFIFLLTEGDLCSLSERGKGAYNMSWLCNCCDSTSFWRHCKYMLGCDWINSTV